MNERKIEYQDGKHKTRGLDLFKETAREIIADRVRDTAKGFWEKMGFFDIGDGNYIWRKRHPEVKKLNNHYNSRPKSGVNNEY